MSPGRIPLILMAGWALLVPPAEMGRAWSRACCGVAAVAVLVSAVRPRGAAPTIAVSAAFLSWVLEPGAHAALPATLAGLLAPIFLVVVQMLATAPPGAGMHTGIATARQVGPAVLAGGVGGGLVLVMTATEPLVSVWWVLAGMAALPAAYVIAVGPFGRTAADRAENSPR